MKSPWWLVILVVVGFWQPMSAVAVEDPKNVPNNRFGIHIVDDNDLVKAAELVNSQKGEWGYVTMVIREDDRIVEKWQRTLDRMRELKLIPIIRLATRVENGVWIKPRQEDVRPWADFLDALNWVVKNRYVILFNEPNHSKEWGDQIRPDEYAAISRLMIDELKAKSQDFFILPAGLDLAAGNTRETMTAIKYWQGVYKTDSELLRKFDGWSSHSYPNPGFSSRPEARGQTSVRGFEWELENLTKYGVRADIPIFITETGWWHREGKRNDGSISAEQVSQYFKTAYESVWNQDKIIAVTPFVLNYQDTPFDHFSWIKMGANEVYPQFDTILSMKKIKGEPVQIAKAEYVPRYFPNSFAVDSKYQVAVRFFNSGQAIWYPDETVIKVKTELGSEVEAEMINETPPGYVAKVWLAINTVPVAGTEKLTIWVERKGVPISNEVVKEVELQPETLILDFKLWMEKLIHHGELLGWKWEGFRLLVKGWV